MLLFITSSLNAKASEIKDTVVVSGAPRSGTTWLGELLALKEGYNLIREPLNLNHPEAKEAGFDQRTCILPGEEVPKKEEYLRKALKGEFVLPQVIGEQKKLVKLQKVLTNRKFVVKCVSANRLLNWLASQFPIKAYVLILRHPCAVVASQIEMEENVGVDWTKKYSPGGSLGEYLGGSLPDFVVDKFEQTLLNLRFPEEVISAKWCLDHYIYIHTLKEDTSSRSQTPPVRITTTYERLLEENIREVNRIYRGVFGTKAPKKVKNRIGRPSGMASSSFERDKQLQLTKWKKKLTKRQIDRILKVVEIFDLDFYSAELKPDYQALSRKLGEL